MRKTWFILWLIATVGITYVANAAVQLVDLQVFPGGSRIEVLALPEKKVQKTSENSPLNENSIQKVNEIAIGENENIQEELIPTTTFLQNSEILIPPKKTEENDEIEIFVDSNEEIQNELELGSLGIETETEIETEEIFEVSTTTVLAAITPTDSGEDRLPENEAVEAPILSTITTTLVPIIEEFNPVVPLDLGVIEARVGIEIRNQLVTGGLIPYKWSLVEGEIPTGIEIDTDGFLTGIPEKSGFYRYSIELSDLNDSTILYPISINISEFRLITSRGGNVTVLISGDSVSFFSGLQSDGFLSPEVIRNGPLVLEVQFLPLIGDETSWIRCEVNEGVICQSD